MIQTLEQVLHSHEVDYYTKSMVIMKAVVIAINEILVNLLNFCLIVLYRT